jgi:predicted peptidase
MNSMAAAENQTVHSFARSLTKDIGYKYLLALPNDYRSDRDKRWPLLLFLHGSEERGDDGWSVARHGPPLLLRSDAATPARQQLLENFVVVSPQCPKAGWWHTETLLALLDEIVETHRIDPRRVYLAGISMGAFGTWELGLAHPERFAAIVPISGGGALSTLIHAHNHKRQELRSLAVWAFHGAKDESVPLDESERMIERLKRVKAQDVQLTVYPEAGHDAWTVTFANPELYRWLLRHERAASSSQ